MTWSQEISQLITDVDQLTSAANVKKSVLDVSVASAEADKNAAVASAAAAAASTATSLTRAQESETHKNTALAIYGTTAAQQTSVISAQASAALASGSAASGSAALQQDLSGIATALHRSPNATTAIFIYDTSKDSDGGAWTEKCQNTSWYNEPIMGKWHGPQPSEFYARHVNASIGPPLVVNVLKVSDFGMYGNNTIVDNGDGTVTLTCVGGSNSQLGFAFAVSALFTPSASKTYAFSFSQITNPNNRSFQIGSTGNSGYTDRVFNSDYMYSPVFSYSILRFTNLQVGDKITFSKTVTVREVTSLNTTSSDYFQLETDGKFYRLWKNLLSRSEEFTTPWILTSTSLATSTIGGYVSAVQFGDNSVQRILRNPFSQITGITYTISAFVQMDDGLAPVVGAASNLGDFSLVTDDNIATSPVVTQIGTTSVYRVSATRVCTTTGARQTGIYKYTTQSARTFRVTGLQLEISSAVTSYELKASETSTSEVFRGNKRDFPRLAGIVADSSNGVSNRVTIYDLTEPGRPMWLVAVNLFPNNYQFNPFVPSVGGVIPTSISALNGIVAIGFSGINDRYGYLRLMNFILDSMQTYSNGSNKISGVGIAKRNTTEVGFTIEYAPAGSVAPGIINGMVNSVAMTVMSDAPIVTVTGLRVPTIAVATGGGVSIIKHDGSVVSGDNQGTNNITITPNIMTWFNTAYTSSRYLLNPGKITIFPALGEYNQSTTEFGANNNTQRDFTAKRSLRLRSLTSSGPVRLLNQNDANIVRGLTGKISNNYNTGWIPGDIRRTYLSDTTVGSIPTAELALNQEFTSASYWEINDASVTISGGRLRFTNTVNGKWARETISATSGQQCIVTINVASITSGALNVQFDGGSGGSIRITQAGTYSYVIPQFQGFSSLFIVCYGTSTTAEVESISVVLAEQDRSYKVKGLLISGTLNKAQLVSGTSLVGYSGWSTANYLREPYSADLDFGTGEFSASAWVNTKAAEGNLLLNSNTSTNRFFQNCDVIDNAVLAPDGTMTAMLVRRINNTTLSRFIDSYSYGGFLNQTLAISFYAKPADTNPASYLGFSWMLNTIGTYKVFLNTFTPSTLTGNGTLVVEPAANGYSRFKFTGLKSNQFRWLDVGIDGYISGGVNFNEGTSDTGIHLWGYQVELDEVSSYKPTTTTAISNVAPIVSRAHSTGPSITLGIDSFGLLTASAFDGTTTRTVTTTNNTNYNISQWLKVEANYTTDGSLAIRVNGRDVAVTRGTPLGSLTLGKNLLSFSESFDNSAWAKYIMTVIPNAAIAPDGTTTADLIYPTTSNTDNSIYRGGFPTVQKTHSVYAKAAGKNWLVILQEDTSGGAAWFNLASGSVGTTSAGFTGAIITPVGSDGWYRCSVTSTSGFNQNIAFGTVDADNTTTVVASGTNGIYLWGAQLETTSSVTSYAATNVAPLTVGNNYALTVPFRGSISLLKLGATVPTTEQSVFMYEQEKQLFRTNAISVLPDSNTILDMSYDDVTDRWVAISTANESYWNGLIRASVTPVSAGAYSKITATSGVELSARITSYPGVDITIPSYVLREELVKRSETANKLNRQIAIYDYIGGFTGNITTGSTAIASVTNLTYPISLVGARISGTGIPANTTITAVSGTTIYISAAATATTTGLLISFLDFNLPIGFETESVTTAGVVKQEGTTKDYTRLFDGFIETIRFAVAPGVTTWVRIQASKSS